MGLPKDSKAIGCRWVFRKDSEQYKARHVAKEYSQKEGINDNDIFSLVVKHTSIPYIYSIVVSNCRSM